MNPQALLHTPLKRACLPISPLRRNVTTNMRNFRQMKFNIKFLQFSQYLVVSFLLSALASFSIPLKAQVSAQDSLQRIIAKEGNSVLGLKASNQLANEYLESRPDSALQLIDGIYPLVKQTGDTSLLIDVISTKGRIYSKREQYDSAIVILEEAEKLAVESNDVLNLSHILDQIGHSYHYKNESQKGIGYLKKSLEYAIAAEDDWTEFKAANNLGRVYSLVSQFDSSDHFLNHALTIAKQQGDLDMQAQILTNLNGVAGYAKDFEKSINYSKEAYALFSQLNNVPHMGLTMRNIGASYYFQGDYPKTLAYFQKSFDLLEGTSHYSELIITIDYMSEAYIAMGDFDNALKYAERALEVWEKTDSQAKNPELFLKKGNVLLLQERFDEALQTFLEAEKIKKETGQFIAGSLYWNMGQCYEQLEKLDEAILCFEKAVSLSLSSNAQLVRVQSITGLGRINELKGNSTKALGFYEEAYQLATDKGYKEKENEAAEGLYRTHKKLNNEGSALRFLEISNAIRDSLFNEENTKEIAKLEAGFEFEKEKQELEFAQQQELEQAANVRRLLWLALGVAALILFIGIYYFRSKQKANAQLSQLNQEILAQKTLVEEQKKRLEELDVAKSRFFTNISHEFRTPLTIISGMASQIKENPTEWGAKGGEMIKQNSANLLNLVNQILDLRKLESEKMKLNLVQADVIPYLRHIWDSYVPYAQSGGLEMHFMTSVYSLSMDFDPEKLLRIVSNIA